MGTVVTGGYGSDRILSVVYGEADRVHNNLFGGFGNDTIQAVTHAFGGDMIQFLRGGPGNDLLDAHVTGRAYEFGEGYSDLDGGWGNDRLIAGGGRGNIVHGGAGDDSCVLY